MTKRPPFAGGLKPASASAFGVAERSLRAAKLQNTRIWEHPRLPVEEAAAAGTTDDILIDVHFYFVALRNLYRFLEKLLSDPAFEALRPRLSEMNTRWFTHYAAGREAFEHIDQRLLGERHADRVVPTPGPGNSMRRIQYGFRLSEGKFFHSDQEWDISSGTCAEIATAVGSLLDDTWAASPRRAV